MTLGHGRKVNIKNTKNGLETPVMTGERSHYMCGSSDISFWKQGRAETIGGAGAEKLEKRGTLRMNSRKDAKVYLTIAKLRIEVDKSRSKLLLFFYGAAQTDFHTQKL